MMDASLWDETIAELSADYRCVAPTLPLGADLSLPGITPLVAEFLDRRNMHEVTLVGNDIGGAPPPPLPTRDAPPRAPAVLLPLHPLPHVPPLPTPTAPPLSR